ncbi:YchJ family protein [Marinomonas sp. A79]|uniref:YchJ family protein n=1 Tax=Marinomonas vulgaris TaxID=2823372 RepID=A0ABS5H947_9GAMM|nr:YchJ family protein [Marinomonas vulgaris]MBR7888000.1 YchJ family protein [Marinomonas vulgaris]
MANSLPCPCGSESQYADCCGIFHVNPGSAPTAESLMRSRYSAFALGQFDYIDATQALPLAENAEDSNGRTLWTKLEIISTEQGMESDTTGKVTFAAHFKEGKHTGCLKEVSMFEKQQGKWFYVSGEHRVEENPPLPNASSTKTGRNDPCTCGSGKKYKKCCATKN